MLILPDSFREKDSFFNPYILLFVGLYLKTLTYLTYIIAIPIFVQFIAKLYIFHFEY